MAEFQRRWGKNFSAETLKNRSPVSPLCLDNGNEINELKPKQIERRKPNTDIPNERNEINEKRLSQQKAVIEQLLTRLRAGSYWLREAHLVWLAGQPDAASDVKFSVGLEAWGALERLLRTVFNVEHCIFGPGSRCPSTSPVVCDFCATKT